MRNSGFSIIPNPFDHQTVISIEHKHLTYEELRIYDLKGQLIRKRNIMDLQQFIIDRGAMAPGTYIIELFSNKEIKRSRMVIE